MSEQDKKEENKPNEELVPKVELEKVKTELTQQTESLKKQVEDAKMQLLSPEYLSYLQDKVSGKKQDNSNESPEVKALKAELAQIRQAQETQAAYIELENVRREHPDFEKMKPEIQKILETSRRDMTIEEAYWIAKGKQEPAKADEKKPGGNEKPGGVHPPAGVSKKTFKNETEAAYAAANEVLTKYGITGDTI